MAHSSATAHETMFPTQFLCYGLNKENKISKAKACQRGSDLKSKRKQTRISHFFKEWNSVHPQKENSAVSSTKVGTGSLSTFKTHQRAIPYDHVGCYRLPSLV
ncbi:hypothetical protein KC19_6G105400 [Ceratodon purpureus]|uniref:Uncharacterized protein n=1 Tax=Ceratodon purpureus TaxID=3225 RepID=A0A8T0HG99_CERPU|nr:hypothetical protein KC19_6G105400 [Ceratodon purpureus]